MATQEFPSIAGHTLLRVIGQGGMSTVYLAEQSSLGRKVALKIMLPEALADEVSRARFENEARTIARLEHPNIVGIHEVGRSADGQPFYSMPYLSRGHLAQRNLVGEQAKVAAILRALLGALDYAHVRGVVHRDVKAENVLFDDTDRPMLADFGIAQQRGGHPRLTAERLAVGSTAYMAPEQARGRDVDRRADLYSMGVLTWEMLTGQLPYSAGDALSMAVKHSQEPIPRLPTKLKHWQPLIDRSMAKQPEDRYASAHEMLAALDAVEQRSGKAFGSVEVPTAFAPEPSAPVRKSGAGRGLALVAGLLVVLAAGAYFGQDLIRSKLQGAPAATDATPGAAATSASESTASATPGATAEPAASDVFPSQGLGVYLANADQQLRDGHLLTPANANAWDSLEAAWRINPTNPITLHLTAQLFDALSNLAESAMRSGDPVSAGVAFERAQTLDTRRGGTGEAIAQLRMRLKADFDVRNNALLAKQDAAAASTLLAGSGWLDLDPARQNALRARIARIPAPAGTAGTSNRAAATTGFPVAPPKPANLVVVSRTEYARFAAASGREAADCGRKLFGRRPRWNTVGSDARPVACVSAADALAYAGWRSRQEGKRYRLPTAGELREQPRSPISGWVTLCADAACSRRAVSGKSQPLDADRGYEDVGIRLVHGN